MQNLKLLAVLRLEIWRHKNFLSRREQVITIRYFYPWNRVKFEKITFLPENIFSGTKFYPLCIYMVFKQNKKIHMFNFSRRLISKTTAATDFAEILPKYV